MDYTRYSVEDLASDETFIAWATGQDPDSQVFWDDFLADHPDMELKIRQARTLVLNLAKAEKRHHPEEQIDRIWMEIDRRIDSLPVEERSGRRIRFMPYLAAAVVSGLLAVVFWYSDVPQRPADVASPASSSAQEADFIEEVNTSGKVLRVHLSDGSTVALGNNSRLGYHKDYMRANERAVYLQGEAFFEVVKDPSKPFLVYSNEVVTRVLGTSFWVKAPDGDQEVIVSVRTGQVSVYTRSKGEEDVLSQKGAVIVLPNQQVTYHRDMETFGKGLVSEPKIISSSIEESDFNFENTPVADVFNVLSAAYGLEIIFDEEVMGNCFFTAPLGSEPLFEKLGIICRAIGARYEVIDAKIVISSAGC